MPCDVARALFGSIAFSWPVRGAHRLLLVLGLLHALRHEQEKGIHLETLREHERAH